MLNLHDALKHTNIDPSLKEVLDTIAATCKSIGGKLKGGALSGVYGSESSENVQGEVQKKLDVVANALLKNALLNNRHVAGVASEEEDDVIGGSDEGRYLVTFDPLDGSSNIDINVSVGTIFSILPTKTPGSQVTMQDFLQPGHQQVAAGYVLYGPAITLVLTTGNGVDMYALDYDGDYYQTHTQIQVPQATQEFAINMSNQRFWEPPMQDYIADLLQGEEGPIGKRFNMRWIASMVAEIHRILTRGGIFMYPWDNREADKPGKLRLMYEGNPMSFLVEQAGGACSTSRGSIMDIQPEQIHQRVPVIMGSLDEVERIEAYHQQSAV
jgi:fructose-1,6-bisphosphatase I